MASVVVTFAIVVVVRTLSDNNFNECNNPNSECCFIAGRNPPDEMGYGIVFNLCPLKLIADSQDVYYQVTDTVYNNDNISYRYTFNIGNTVLEYPSNICAQHQGAYCDQKDSNGQCQQPVHLINDTFPAKGGAYMELMDEVTGEIIECWNLGGIPIKTKTYPLTNFLSPMKGDKNYATGIQLHYENGDYDENTNINRYISFNFLCKNTYDGNGMVQGVPMYKSRTRSEYALVFESLFGCPAACISGSQLCSTNGVCGYDFTLNDARCYCFQGFTGDFCEKEDENYDLELMLRGNDETENDEKEEDEEQYVDNDFVHKIPTDYYSSSGERLNVTFDLNPMINEIGKYLKVENLNDPSIEFYLNFVGKMRDRERTNMSFDAYSKCYKLDNGNGYGFLYDTIKRECYLIGSDIEYGLIDNSHPGKGWYWKWYDNEDNTDNTDECVENGRSFIMPLYCPDTDEAVSNPPPIFPYPIHQLDYIGCNWKSEQIVPFGCPKQCIKTLKSEISPKIQSKKLTKYSICSLHGVCAFDPYKEDSTCLCDTGYKGDDCSISIINAPTSTPTIQPTHDGGHDDEHHAFISFNKQMFLIIIGGIAAFILLLIIAVFIFCKCYIDGQKKLYNFQYHYLQNNAESDNGQSSMEEANNSEYSNDSEPKSIDVV